MPKANSTSLDRYEVWFLTGSQQLYGDDILKQVAAQSREIAAALNASSEVPVKLVWKPVLTDSEAIRRTALEANADDSVIGVTAWMHTFSPAKMWINGLDLLRKPLLHLHTQANRDLPWADIDFDFMNLNQAAHGDREFGYIQSRLGVPRKTVVGHVSNPEVARQLGAWQRASAGWAAVRTLKLTRFGDNMRNVAPRATKPKRNCVLASRSTRGRSTSSRTPSTGLQSPTSTPWWPSTSGSTTWFRNCGPAAPGTNRCATAHGSNSA